MNSKQIFEALKIIQEINEAYTIHNMEASGKEIENYFRYLYKEEKENEIRILKIKKDPKAFQVELTEALKEIDGANGI